MGSDLLTTQRFKSLSEDFTRELSMLEFSETWDKESTVLEASLPYISNLANCCYANYHRNIAPKALGIHDIFRTDPDSLFDELREVVPLKRQLEAFLNWYEGSLGQDCQLGRGRQALRLLGETTQDLNELLSLEQAKTSENDSEYLGRLIQAQIDEAKEAKKTSEKLGYLNQPVYIFLPLQLTASAMGLNLENFGTGNIQLRTFLLMLAAIATLAFVLMLFPVISYTFRHRIHHIRMMTQYSRRAAYLFGWFCLFHRNDINEQLWDSGIYQDVQFFRGSWPKRNTELGHSASWNETRTKISVALRKPPFVFFPRYWQAVLDVLWDIIDTPQWGRKDENLYTT